MSALQVTYDEATKLFHCIRVGDTGMFIIGSGVSVLEAVGDWVVYSGKVQVICDPPALLETGFQVDPAINRERIRYKPADKRG